MFGKLRMNVPLAWVTWIALIVIANPASYSLESQLGGTNLYSIHSVNLDVPSDHLDYFVQPSTVIELTCDSGQKMRGLTDEQKQVIRNLYKFGRKSIKLKSHINFLSNSLETQIIPKSFKVNKEIPGNQVKNQEKLDKVSLEAVRDEKERQSNILKSVETDLEKSKRKLKQLFDPEAEKEELKRLGKHLRKVEKEEEK